MLQGPTDNSDVSWVDLSDAELLEKRICDITLSIEGSDLEEPIQELYKNLEDKQISFHPLCYLSNEWFVLEGETAIGIPFYLAHPRLKKLEDKMMLEVEGGTKAACLKLLRHEAGHALFYAYHLNRKREVHRVFGPSPDEVPETYRPKPYSKSFVRHLDNWYAQAEPDEDFAETFAVWLTPDFDWREYYQGWPALQKLELVDKLVKQIAGKPPLNHSQVKTCWAARLKIKLKNYYIRKQKLYAQDYPDFYDRDLKFIFSEEVTESSEKARDFMRRHQKLIINKVSQWTGEKKFIVNNLFKKLTERCQNLKLKVCKSESETLLEVTAYLTSMTSNYLYTGKFKPFV